VQALPKVRLNQPEGERKTTKMTAHAQAIFDYASNVEPLYLGMITLADNLKRQANQEFWIRVQNAYDTAMGVVTCLTQADVDSLYDEMRVFNEVYQ
jgi:hypothetical protein